MEHIHSSRHHVCRGCECSSVISTSGRAHAPAPRWCALSRRTPLPRPTTPMRLRAHGAPCDVAAGESFAAIGSATQHDYRTVQNALLGSPHSRRSSTERAGACRRGGSLSPLSAVRHRSPARVPWTPRTLAFPCWLCCVHAAGFNGSGGGRGDFAYGRSRAHRRDARCCACAQARQDRAWSAAVRRSTHGERLELAAAGLRDGWAACWSHRPTLASHAAVCLSGRRCAGAQPVHVVVRLNHPDCVAQCVRTPSAASGPQSGGLA